MMNSTISNHGSVEPLRFRIGVVLPGLISFALAFATPALAWDAVGHRVSAMVAVEFLEPGVRQRLVAILEDHPRFQEDFLDEVPGFIDPSDPFDFERWLLGQAAFWPDIARGLPRGERVRYHRGNWHYIDGAWLRGLATEQGNSYVGLRPLPDVTGLDAAAIRGETDVDNVVLALDYNMGLLTYAATDSAERAVALCWVLHLVGDIHQPLHTGSLFSARLFESGDAGGNGIDTSEGNLHAVWDRALREAGVLASVDAILAWLQSMDRGEIESAAPDSTLWLRESRELVTTVVYPDSVEREILAAERERRGSRSMREIRLPAAYLAEMRRISEQRLGLAALRMALLFNRNL